MAMPIAVVGARYTEEYARMTAQVAEHVEEERVEYERELRQMALEYAQSHPELLSTVGSSPTSAFGASRRWNKVLSEVSAASAAAEEAPLPLKTAPKTAELSVDARMACIEAKLDSLIALLSSRRRAGDQGERKEFEFVE